MPTRLYFSYTIGSVVNPAYDTAWEITSTALTRSMMLTKSPDGAFGTNSGQAMALDEDILICQAISDPLDGAQTVGGVGVTVEGFVEGESVNWDSMFPYISIRVVSEDGTVVRGTLFVGPGHAGNPWPAGGASEARQIMDAGLAVASVAASDRDRIVVEFGADPDVGAGAGPPYDIELTFGRPSGVNDITVEGDVGKVPWIEFSQTLKFVSPSTYDGVLLYLSDSELILGASLPRTPVTYKGVLLDPSGLLTGVWTAGPAPQTFAGILLDPSGLLVSPAPSTAYTHAVSDTIGLLDAVAVAERQFRTSVTSDTLRGGAVIIFSSTRNLSDKSLDQTLHSTSVPAGWTPSASAGSIVSPTAKGLLMQTANTPASSTLAVIAPTYGDYFDMKVTASVETLSGSIPSVSSINRVAGLVVYTAGYVILSTIQYIQGAFYAVSQAGAAGGDPILATSSFLGATPAAIQNVQLRITCGEDRVWISVGETPAVTMALPGFTAQVKTAQLQTSNDTTTGGILGTRYTDFEVRSVGLIAGRFIDNSTYDQPSTIVGNVPAAKTRESFDMDDLGRVDIEVFGPWGRTLIADGFEYTKPIPKIWSGGIGESPATLDLITDPMIRSDS